MRIAQMCGVRPISHIVDTQLRELELGQPMHAFDLQKMRGGVIKARRARAGETMTTLDGKQRTLTSDMLVIADAEHAEDIAGVMGGANSEVTSSTTQIAFEAAYFKPGSIRATRRSSAQNRGVDALRARHGHHRPRARWRGLRAVGDDRPGSRRRDRRVYPARSAEAELLARACGRSMELPAPR